LSKRLVKVQNIRKPRTLSKPLNPLPDQPHIGHSMLPQTDESVRLRSKKSLNAVDSLPSPPLVLDSVLAMSDDDQPLVGLLKISNSDINSLGPRRIFILDLQHAQNFQINDQTTARNIVDQAVAVCRLVPSSDWALLEVWKDLGLERPIRENERIGDVLDSWHRRGGNDASLLIVTKSHLARHLVPKVTTSSEAIGNYVRLEVKRGKWEKRWLALEGEQITHRKSENSKEKVLLCTLANWDIFQLSNQFNRSPKPWCLALKSINRLEIFENVQDAVHYFGVKTQQERNLWMGLMIEARKRYLVRPTIKPINRRPTSPPKSISSPTFSPPAGTLLSKVIREPPLIGETWDQLNSNQRKEAMQKGQAKVRAEGQTLEVTVKKR